MERVTNTKHIIGFSCGHQFVITKRTAFSVNIDLFNKEFIYITLLLIIFTYITDVYNISSILSNYT